MAYQLPEPFLRPGSSGAFYFMYTDANGKRRMKSTGKTTKRDARLFIRAFMARLHSGVDVPFRIYAEPFFVPGHCPREARLRADGRSFGAVHMKKSREWLDRFVLTDPVFPGLPMNEIKRRDVLDLRASLIQKYPRKLNSVGKALEAVKTVLSEAMFREDIASNPGSMVTPPTYTQQERGTFTQGEVVALLGAMPDLVYTDHAKGPDTGRRPRIAALMTTLFLTGMRLGEIRGWRWEDVELDTSRFSVVRATKDTKGTIGPPKWGKPRHDLAMPGLLHDALTEWRAQCRTTYVFGSIDDTPITETVIRKAWHRMLAHAHKAKILAPDGRHLTPHSCRHTLNTLLLAARVPPLDVQLYLGWQSDAAKALTRVQHGYTHMRLMDTTTVADAIDKMYSEDETCAEASE